MDIVAQAIQEIRNAFPDVIAVYLFGSHGTKFETHSK